MGRYLSMWRLSLLVVALVEAKKKAAALPFMAYHALQLDFPEG